MGNVLTVAIVGIRNRGFRIRYGKCPKSRERERLMMRTWEKER